MLHWNQDGRQAFAAELARANAEALRPWTVVASALSLALVLVALGLAPAHVGVPYGPAVALVAVATAGLALASFRQAVSAAVIGPLSVGLVVSSGLILGWVLLGAPAAVAPVAGGFLMVALAGGLLFSWDLPLAIGVQAALLVGWLLGVTAGPGWGADTGQLVACSALLIGAQTVSLVAQRQRRVERAEGFHQLREAARVTRVVDEVRASQHATAQARDRLFSDVTNGLREPVVRLLRAVRDQMDTEPETASRLAPTWSQGLRLLRKLDDVGTLALYHRGHLRLRVRRVQLGQELRRVVELAQEAMAPSGLSLDLVVDEVPEDLHVDPERLERVLVVMLAEALRACPPDADVQVEVGQEQGAGGVVMARIEVWCDKPEAPVDRAAGDDFWREPEGASIEVRLAHALAEFHGGRLVQAPPEANTLSWVLSLRAGTQHLTDATIDRRVRAVDSDRGRRFEDRAGMTWAADLAATDEYRLLDVQVMAEAIGRELDG